MTFFKTLSAAILVAALGTGAAQAAGGAKHPHSPENADGSEYEWSFEGPFGSFDKASLQRGYQVYREVCGTCHSMDLMSFRNLSQKGGPYEGDEEMAKAFAAEYIYTEIDDAGDEVERPGRTSDPFWAPYANEQLARSVNGGALPPDFSVIIKARHAGPDYLYSLMTGYPDPEDFEAAPTEADPGRKALKIKNKETGEIEGTLYQPSGLYYNPYFPGDTTPNWDGDPRHAPYGGFLAMPPQLPEFRVEYSDGTAPTTSQMAKDIVYFLTWAAEPKQEVRKKLGLATMGYLFVLAILLYFSYRQIWRNVEH